MEFVKYGLMPCVVRGKAVTQKGTSYILEYVATGEVVDVLAENSETLVSRRWNYDDLRLIMQYRLWVEIAELRRYLSRVNTGVEDGFERG